MLVASSAFGRRVPDVKELAVTSGGNDLPIFASGAIQRRTNLGLALRQSAQGHFDSSTLRQLVQVLQDGGHDLLMFSMAALRDVNLRHGLEMHGRNFGLAGSHETLLA